MSETTNSSMTHDEALAQIGSLALGALDAGEERAILDHVDGCRECQAELASMREVVAEMPELTSTAVLPTERSRAIRASLVERAEKSIATAPANTGNNWRTYSIAATFLIAALGAAYYKEYSETTALSGVVAERNAVADSLAGLVRAKDELLAAMTGPGVSVVELTSSAVQAPSARMFWDRATNRWTMYAHGLAALQPGRAYELWLVTADNKIPAGTFKPGPDGSATFTATYALQPSELKAIAVTEEPEAGVPAPTGPIILLGTAEAS